MESGGAVETGAPKNKIWLGVLGAFLVAIVGLVIAIVVVKNLPRGEENNTNNDTETIAYPEKSQNEEIYEQFSENINMELQKNLSNNSEEVFAVYDRYIDDTDINEEVRDMLRVDKYQAMMLYDVDKIHGEAVITGLLEMDGVLKNIRTAIVILNAANYYENETLANEYTNILNSRQTDKGLDLTMETDG